MIETSLVSKPSKKVICLFCGSSPGNDPIFMEAATKLGKALVDNGYGLVYGGGDRGLMGAVCKSVVSHGGYAHGIIPEALFERERNTETDNGKLGKVTVVQDMHTRKRLMGQEADAFITLPGGYGTLEELAEVTTWSQLGIHAKPVIAYNIGGFYDGLKTFFEKCADNGFVGENQRNVVVFADSIDEVINQVEHYKLPEGRYNLSWKNQ